MAFQDNHSTLNFTFGQEIGRRRSLRTQDWLSSSLYSSFKSSSITETTPHRGHNWGAVFGLGFSPDGKILTATCEHRCMMLYDPLNAKLITRRFDTHDDCVNCVRFLDNRIFATCSDDNTVRLWDSRYLTKELRILRGHSSWVKNIEYSSSSGKLVTSGFDGNIFAWDINDYSEKEHAKPMFYINGALRMKMTTDERKLIVSTLGGYFLLIHDLDLDHLKQDLSGFKPHLYRLMQLMNTPLHHALQYNYMFTRQRNRVEFMCDFPDSDNAESIATMQIHPHNWCIVSRNTTLDEETEWTCVHDIQSTPPTKKLDHGSHISLISSDPEKDFVEKSNSSSDREKRKRQSSQTDSSRRGRWNFFSPMFALQDNFSIPESEIETDVHSYESSSSDEDEDEEDDDLETTMLLSLTNERQDMLQSSSLSSQTSEERLSSPTDPNSSSDIVNDQNDASSYSTSSLSNSANSLSPPDESTGFPLPMPLSCSRWRRRRMAIVHDTDPYQQQGSSRTVWTEHLRIRNVKPRLLYYATEPNVGRGFIKEQCFSSDGRVIASPFGNHVRILAFDKGCQEICDNVPVTPRPLVEVSNCALLKSHILTSTFSPVHCLLAAGAVDGSIAFSHPIL